MLKIVLISTLLGVSLAVVRAFIDAYLIKKKYGKIVSLNHHTRLTISVLVLALFDAFYLGFDIKNIFILSYQYWVYTAIFDVLLNRLRGLDYWYVGKTAKADILVRKILGEDGGMIYFALKLLLALVSLDMYVIYFEKIKLWL